MSQADGYVRIVTQNDTTEAQRSTEQLGDTIHDSLNTTPVDHMNDAMGGLEDGINATGDAALKTGDIIKANLVSDIITQGIQKIGSALKSAAGDAVNMALSNETAFAKASTLLSGDDFTKYFQGLIDMSNRTGVAFADLAESMYSALSAGVPQDNVLEFVENNVNLAKGGFTQTATAIDIVTTALNAYHMEMDEATHVQDVLITTQNLGKTTVDELASNMGKLIPTANGVNIAFDQLGAMYATVTANGVATAEATTYLNSMINELGASGSTAEKAMQAATVGTDMAGKKFSEISAMGYDVTDVLKLMDDYAQSTGKSLSDMFSSSEGAKAASILLSNMEGFKNNITSMIDSTGAAATAAETMMDTTAEKIQVAQNQINNLTSAIAEQLLPVIGETAQETSEAINSDDVKDIADNIGSFISVTLSLLLKNIKLIASAISGATAAVIAFKTAAMITKVIQSWQTAVLQVKLLGSAQGVAAVKTAALNGQLTVQETIYALLSGKLDVATAKQMALNTAMSMNPAGLIAAAVGLLATALTGVALSAANASESTNQFNDKLKTMKQATEDSIADGEAELIMLQKKSERYDKLRSAVSLTSEEHEELARLAGDLQNTLGDEAQVVNSLTGEYNDLSKAVDDYINKRHRELLQSAYESDAKEALKQIRINQHEADQLSDELFDLTNWDESDSPEADGPSKKDSARIDEIQKRLNEIDAENQKYQKIVDDYDSIYSGGMTTSKMPSTPSTSKSKTGDFIDIESQKKTYKTIRDELKKEYELGEIDAATYYSNLEALRDRYLSYAVESDEWHDATLEIKKYRDQLTEEQKKAYEQQVAAQKKAAEEAATARKQAYTEEKSQLEFKLKTNQISEKKYYTELSKLRDKYLDKNSSEWRSAYLETYEYNQKIIQANKDALNQLLSDTRDSTLTALEKITAARDSLTAKLTDFNKTFEKVTETIPETIAVKGEFTITTSEHEEDVYKMGADSIEDNIKVLEDYGAMLDALKARGADESTLSSILDMDIEEGMKYGTELLKMSDQAWGSYFDSLDRLHKTAADISAKYYQSQVDDLRENFIDKMRKELDGLGTDMYKVGADVAAEFVKGWNEAMGTKDLTVGELMRSVSGGTMSTAPTAAKALSAASGTNSSAAGKAASQIVKIPVYIGTQKLADIIADVTNGKIIQTGKNILLT